MTPENSERALYYNILNLSVASKKFTQLEDVLLKVTNVFEVNDMLTDILHQGAVKLKLLKKLCGFKGK